MSGRAALLFVIMGAAGPCLSQTSGYLPPDSCAPCHRQIYETYRQTGMGRSFRAVASESTGAYDHLLSQQRFTIYQRDGRFYQRREPDSLEMSIDFVLGSGNHARTYLHRTPAGELIELPVAWYRENGGTFAMNPGYDRPDHMDFRRKLDRECFFCHNAYPRIADTPDPALSLPGAIPDGIDCQRCHGPGRAHVASGRPADIVNPARLTPQRQNEICFQCHLESTSQRLPYAVRRYGRGFFSYRPGEPLADYILHFDHAPGAGYDDKFEIDGAAYRLMKSACYRKSSGALACTTCHDPHTVESTQRANRACRTCHQPHAGAESSCVDCHMPKRRTDDVVHVVMTDHDIQRVPPRTHDTARGPYRGEVALLYPPTLSAAADRDLYTAVAQVIDGANYNTGIPALRKAIETWRPEQPEFYFELGNALSHTAQSPAALPYFEEALRRRPDYPAARRNFAQSLIDAGHAADAIKTLEAAPRADAATLNTLGAAYLTLGNRDRSAATLRRALRLDDSLPETYINLANALASNNRSAAMDALTSALRLQPGSAAAHTNLATLINATGDFASAREHFDRALRSDPDYAAAHYNFGRALFARKLYADAQSHLTEALRLDPHLAEAAVTLGMTLMQTGHLPAAIDAYRQALRIKPALTVTRYNLALALLAQGDKTEAIEQFEAVTRATPTDYEAHLRLGKLLLETGNPESARRHLESATQSPDPKTAAAARDALRKQ